MLMVLTQNYMLTMNESRIHMFRHSWEQEKPLFISALKSFTFSQPGMDGYIEVRLQKLKDCGPYQVSGKCVQKE